MAIPVMKERQEPRFIQFATGEAVEGVLVTIEHCTVKDNPAIRYTVREDDGNLVCFLGTYQLNVKLRPSDCGHYISVRCEGEDTMIRRGDNNMKIFKVLVSEDSYKDGSLYVTDNDIPF